MEKIQNLIEIDMITNVQRLVFGVWVFLLVGRQLDLRSVSLRVSVQ